MRSLSRVVWSEGMYLGTHHFQAQSRYFEESIQFMTSALWSYTYGLLGCEMDTEALRNGTVAIIHARGVLPDGLLFQMPELDPLPPAREVAGLFPPTADSLLVYLSVPKLRPNAMNTRTPESNGNRETRYIAEPDTIFDETNGRDQKPVVLGRKNIRIGFPAELEDDSASLAIARITRSPSGEFVYDTGYVPASLQLSANARLMALLKSLVDVMEDKSNSLESATQTKTSAQSGYSAREIANFWFRHALNSSLASLRHFLFSKRGHPEELYVELVRLAGALSTFSLDSNPRALPLYDHDHPDVCFRDLEIRIRGYLETVLPTNCISIPLKPTGDYFWAGEVKDQRVLGRSHWIFAIHSALDETELVSRTPPLIKVCSRQFVPELVKRALPGLSLTHLPVPPAAVNARVETQYFTIGKAGPCWSHLVETRMVGVYVPGEFPSPEIEILVVIET